MRIISGFYKGKKIKGGGDLSIRPTTNKIKEYIFNILQDFPTDKIVVDIFSGSGSLGLEALSRGAKKIIFVENKLSSIKVLKENIDSLRIPEDKYKIIQSDAIEFSRTNKIPIDLCLMDPPFIYPQLQELLNIFFFNDFFYQESLLVVEHEINNPIGKESNLYNILKQKKTGRSLISFLEKRA
ncbi:MAG: 16S rRNA (guanine(966)-N(2))-methyltransferase RsmD [Calditrichales bacterium]|nr:16S rRNA (guanine(966)-N(2))-methyltransferase RsmD [Calditrichales bacterium]